MYFLRHSVYKQCPSFLIYISNSSAHCLFELNLYVEIASNLLNNSVHTYLGVKLYVEEIRKGSCGYHLTLKLPLIVTQTVHLFRYYLERNIAREGGLLIKSRQQ